MTLCICQHSDQFPQTDRTRATDIELHIQKRVEAELKRLEEAQTQRLSELRESLKQPEPSSPTLGDKIQQSTASVASRVTGQSSSDASPKDLDRAGVQKEINALRTKLSQRKLKEDVVNDKLVDKARSAVVECLRVNDRRPLDCWAEVEEFRSQVARLEGQFLGKILE